MDTEQTEPVAEVPPIAAIHESDEDPPEEVANDAVEELNRIHAAQQFDAIPDTPSGFDPSYGMTEAPVAYAPVVSPGPAPVMTAPEPALPSSRELKTLEDLYDAYPEIGNGSYHLRVVRKHPTNWQNLRIAGFLSDIHEQITLVEFASRFGGHTYEVSVRGPGRSSTVDSKGETLTRTLVTIRVDIPGVPKMLSPSQNGAGSQMSSANSFFGAGAGPHPTVQIRRMDLEAEADKRREERERDINQRLSNQQGLDPHIFQQIEEAASRRGDEARSASLDIIAGLREHNNRMIDTVAQKDVIIQKLREDIVLVKTESANRFREEETKQVRELKERQDTEIRRIKEDQASIITRAQSEHQRAINELTERAQREREQIQRVEQSERERLRDDANRRESSLQEEFARRETSMRADYEARTRESDRAQERELRSVKEMRSQTIESIRSSESGKAVLAEKTASLQKGMMDHRVSELIAQVNSLTRQNDEMQAKYHKTPMEAVREAHEIAEATGFGGGGGVSEEPFDWKKGAVGAIQGLIEKAPEIARGLGDARQQNQHAVARAQQQAQHARVAAARSHQVRQQRMAQAPPSMVQRTQAIETVGGPQPRQSRPVAPPGMGPQPRTWDQSPGPPEPGTDSGMPGVMQGPPMGATEPLAHNLGSPPPPPSSAMPIAGGNPVESPGSPLQPHTGEEENKVSEQAQAQPPPAQAVAEPQDVDVPQKDGSSVNITQEQVMKFAQQLDLAISSGIVSPAQFAKSFIEEAGPDVTRTIMGLMTPDQLVDAIASEEGSASTSIVTRDGREFVRALWAETAKLLSQVLTGAQTPT